VGNGALIDGTERVIREDFPEEVSFVREPWDEYFIEGVPGPRKFDQSFVDKVNACDALIAGGAVMFREDHIRFKMPLGITKPIVFYGVSYRVWEEYSHYYVMGRFGGDIARSLSYPKCIFGVRNDGTERWLWSKLGLHHDKIETIPDPGLYIEPSKLRHIAPIPPITNIVVALNNEDDLWRYGTRKSDAMRILADALCRIWEDHRRINIILSPHTFEDYDLLKALIHFLPQEMAYQNVVSTGLVPARNAVDFYSLYQQVDLIIAMRIHAMVPAIGLGIPMLALSSSKRMDEFMKDVGLSEYLVGLFRTTAGALAGKIEGCLTYPTEVRVDFMKAGEKMRARTKAFNEKIYNFIKEAL